MFPFTVKWQEHDLAYSEPEGYSNNHSYEWKHQFAEALCDKNSYYTLRRRAKYSPLMELSDFK